MIRQEVGEPQPVGRELRGGPATMFRLPGALGRIGIIDPVSGHFCGTCNRLRLTAERHVAPVSVGAPGDRHQDGPKERRVVRDPHRYIRRAVLSQTRGPTFALRCDPGRDESDRWIEGPNGR